MIGPYLKRFGETLEIVSPVFQGFGNSEHLFIIDLVVTLGLVHGLGSERDWMPEAIIALLGYDPTCSKTRSIDFQTGWVHGVPHCEN